MYNFFYLYRWKEEFLSVASIQRTLGNVLIGRMSVIGKPAFQSEFSKTIHSQPHRRECFQYVPGICVHNQRTMGKILI